VSAAGKPWNDRELFSWINRVSNAAGTSKMAPQSYSTGINQQNVVRLFWYSDWLPRYPSPKLKKLKIYAKRCVNGRHRKKYFKYDNFLTLFCLLLSVECFGQILRKSVKSTYPINSLKVDTFYEKSNARFLLKKVCKELTPPQEIMSPLETASQWRNRTSWRQLQWVRISREKCCITVTFSIFWPARRKKSNPGNG